MGYYLVFLSITTKVAMSNPDYASQKLSLVSARIARACENCNRSQNAVTLIGASKKQSPALISDFIDAGLTALGENYLQESIEKQAQLNERHADWHFIGQIQSNKTKPIAQHFTWVHGVDRLKVAARLAQQHQHAEPINLLIQLNPDEEHSKAGVAIKEAAQLADQIAALDGANLRGFMMIPKARDSFSEQRRVFAQANELLQQTNQRYGLHLDQLSMGMSGDLEAAIHEGSTMVRVGTDLFGPRD